MSWNIGHQMAQFALVPNLAIRWSHMHWLQIWPPDGTTCISFKIGHQMAPLTWVAKLATRWRHLHELKYWPPDGATCISCTVGHQMAPLALVPNLDNMKCHLHWFQFWPPDGATWPGGATCIAKSAFSDLLQIGSKFCHQVTSLALLGSKVGHQVVSLALPHYCLGMPYWHYQLVLSLYIHQPDISKVKF